MLISLVAHYLATRILKSIVATKGKVVLIKNNDLKARVWSSKIPTGYGKWDGLILSLLSYQFEFYWLLLDCKQKHMVAFNTVC